jgi:hypothetical protein
MPWKKGQSGNPGGKKRSEPRLLLEQALRKWEKEHDESFWDHLISRAAESDQVLIALARKLIPDLAAIDANIGQLAPFRLILSNGHKSTKTNGSDTPGQ